MRPYIHLALHFLVPAALARVVYPGRWVYATLIMLAAFAIDLDHLLAEPVYDPGRCGIGFHPLHTWPAMLVYLALSLVPQTRILGIGLLIHIALDSVDCVWLSLE